MISPTLAAVEAYVKKYLPKALQAVQTGPMATIFSQLSLAEKALIYHYTGNGYKALNAKLHASQGANRTMVGRGLVAALAKLPAHQTGMVYSGVKLDATQLQEYLNAFTTKVPVAWPAFLSTSIDVDVAVYFLYTWRKNCLFLITSKTGRRIELLSVYGANGQYPDPDSSEAEVLFSPNTRFKVLEFTPTPDFTRIALVEL